MINNKYFTTPNGNKFYLLKESKLYKMGYTFAATNTHSRVLQRESLSFKNEMYVAIYVCVMKKNPEKIVDIANRMTEKVPDATWTQFDEEYAIGVKGIPILVSNLFIRPNQTKEKNEIAEMFREHLTEAFFNYFYEDILKRTMSVEELSFVRNDINAFLDKLTGANPSIPYETVDWNKQLIDLKNL